ncbi:hypothetical protein [Profundibacterium mesophilum]|uniref:Antitoxin n=1 Tax=Profundibacterium mesophilum KAUST100406-0324 TaxID=1037889 RepID=A0A921TBY2_9RHOB|nr:hypothetical protein [Profundibacterium mesophilum]KAF0675013.1 hypothetical protein PMES_02722 [Profundibacterium mesophilum KAUST100406-0324]
MSYRAETAPQDDIDRLVDSIARDPSRAEAVKLALRACLPSPPGRPVRVSPPVRDIDAELEEMWDNVPV